MVILEPAQVSLHIPAGALSRRTLLSIEVKDGNDLDIDGFHLPLNLTPMISCKPPGLVFLKAVELSLPHSAVFDDANLHKSVVYFNGYSLNDLRGMGDKRPVTECFKIFKEHFCHVYTNVFADIKVSVSEAIKRRVGVEAYIREDQKYFVIEVWLVNDVPSEYVILKHLKEKERSIPFNTTGKFIFDYHLPYSVEVQPSFNGNYFEGANNEKSTLKKMLDKDSLVDTGRWFHSFKVAKRYTEFMVIVLQGSSLQCCSLKKDNHGTSFTTDDVSSYCEELSRQLLNWKLDSVPKQRIFDEDTIRLLKKTSIEIEENRRRKNFGVIGGSSVSVVGGVMSIVGAALIPVTFGASIGLLASGISISVAGTAISIGFSFDKIVKDRMRRNKTKECLKNFIDFQGKLLKSIANIFAARAEIHRLRLEKEICIVEANVCDAIKRYIVKNDAGHTVDIVNLTDVLTEILKQSEALIKCLQEVEQIIGKDLLHKENDSLKTIGKLKHDIAFRLKENSGREFGVLARAYLQFGVEAKSPASGISLPALDAIKLGLSTSVETGALAARAAIDVSDDFISAGGNALKIAQGISAASIVLGVLGVVFDVAFIGHAIYDLDDMKDNKEKFSQGLFNIADLMTIVNEMQLNCGDTENLAEPEPREGKSSSSSHQVSTGHI